jgi:hypothetical protein
MNNNPKWWNQEHESRWQRVKLAFKRDWEQTRHDFGANRPDMDQDVDDTVKQAVGKRPVPPVGARAYEDVEDACRFGYGARRQYTRYAAWNDELEAQLQSDWRQTYSGCDWNKYRAAVRKGWEYQERIAPAIVERPAAPPASSQTRGTAPGVRKREKTKKGRKAVFALCDSQERAGHIVDDLKREGFVKDDISVLFADSSGTRDFAHEKHTKAPEGAATGATTGGVLGGVFGWLAGIGLLAIPGVGPFVAAGPIMAALSGAAIGAGTGGLIGALIGLGIPEYEAKRYEGKLRAGSVLISVHCDDSDEVRRAKALFQRSGAEDISATGEEKVSAHSE